MLVLINLLFMIIRSGTRVSYRYHLAVSPASGSVYISDPEAHKILKVKNPDDFSNPEENYVNFVGSGKRCLPGDDIGCGDGGRARDAKLQYPKGMAVSNEEILYFADGTNVRSVDSDGIINTVVGSHRLGNFILLCKLALFIYRNNILYQFVLRNENFYLSCQIKMIRIDYV